MSKEALLSQYFEDRLALEAVWRSKRDAAAYLAGHADALDRALHQRLMPQMNAVKITQRNRARLLIFLHRAAPF